jgi:peptidoglycan/LPS O-acetylase OafA/YrhL
LQIFYAMPIFRLGEFVIGVLLFFILQKRPRISEVIQPVSLCLVSFCILYLALIGKKLPIYVGHNWIVIPAVASTLLALSDSSGSIVGRALSSIPSVWLGRISYCFYSFQFHVLLIVGVAGTQLNLSSVERFWTAFILLIMISGIGYHLIEEPARRWLQQRSRMSTVSVPKGAAVS